MLVNRTEEMAKGSSASTSVTLVQIADPRTTVTVGLRFAEDVVPHRVPVFRREFESPPLLDFLPECQSFFKTPKKHLSSCLGSIFCGVSAVLERCKVQKKCIITAVVGTCLKIDSGVGFALAGHLAASRALGVDPRSNLGESGWTEVEGK